VIILVHLPKTGGVFASSYFKYILEDSFQHGYGANAHCSATAITNLKVGYSVGFVRNPWDYYVSRYHYFINTRPLKTIENGPSKHNDAGIRTEDFENSFPTFESHLKFGINNSERCTTFWFSQLYDYMFKLNGEVIINFIGKLESLCHDLLLLLKINNIKPIVTPRKFLEQNPKTKHSSNHEHYSTYYTQELIDIVAEKDKVLIEGYGYDF
jgi:hypothetical protein